MALATPYQHTPIDPKSGEIRFLVLLPPSTDEDPNAPINCRIETSSTSKTPGHPYDILSHTCDRDATDRKQEDILINDSPFRIPSATAIALRRLQHHGTTRIWTSAICINQIHPTEKAQHVILKPRIYAQANRVCIWLCESDSQDWMSDPWWNSLVGVSEAALARPEKLVVMLGSGKAMPWVVVERTLRKRPKAGKPCTAASRAFDIITRLQQRKAADDQGEHLNICAVLHQLRCLECPNPRDRIYALYGLAPRLSNRLGVFPNCDDPSIKTAQIYTDSVRNLIEATGSLNILNLAREWRHVQATTKPDSEAIDGHCHLPSWVPNLAATTTRDPAPLLDLTDFTNNPIGSNRYGAARLLKASLVEKRPGSDEDDDAQQLIISGIRFDEVSDLGIPYHPPTGTGADAAPISRKGIKPLEQWEDLAMGPRHFCPYSSSIADDAEGSLNPRKEALLRTYIADHALAESRSCLPRDHLLTYIESWCDRVGWTSSPIPSSSHLSPSDMEASLRSNPEWAKHTKTLMAQAQEPNARNPIRAAKQSLTLCRSGPSIYSRYALRIHTACAHRRLLVTKRGYIGVAPWNAEVGDVVAVLHGGDTPFLLRPAGKLGEYELVGECFVYGIMGGEALAWEHAVAAVRNFRII